MSSLWCHNLYLLMAPQKRWDGKGTKEIRIQIQKQDHYKHILTILEDVIETFGWKEGQDVEPTIENGKLILKPRR